MENLVSITKTADPHQQQQQSSVAQTVVGTSPLTKFIAYPSRKMPPSGTGRTDAVTLAQPDHFPTTFPPLAAKQQALALLF